MTTRPTDEEIRAMADMVGNCMFDSAHDEHQWKIQIKCASLLSAWLAERQAARDGVTSEVVQKAYNALLADMDPIEGVSLGCMRKALKVVSTEIRITEVTDEVIDKAMTAYDEFLGAEDEADYEAMRAALQSIAPPIDQRQEVTDEMVNHAAKAYCDAIKSSGPHEHQLQGIRAALKSVAQPVRVLDREYLGKQVRGVWIAWAKEQPAPKASWLIPWEGLSERDKEVDRRIGEHIAVLSTSPQLQGE